MKKLVILFLVFLFGTSSAQDAKLIVELSVDSVMMGNFFEVKFTLENTQAKNFDPPSFEGFIIVGGPNHASSFSMINGEVSQRVSYSYYLEPQDIGHFFIGPASVDTGKEILESLPVEIVVLDNPDNLEQDSGGSLKKKFPFMPKEEPEKSKKPKKKRKIYKI